MGLATVTVVVVLCVSCRPAASPALDRVPVGTWGGEDAGLIVGEDAAHAHVRCTLGDIEGLILLDEEGRFDVAGTYNVNAFPIDRGILHPARFTGSTDGRTLTFTARLTDTGQAYASGRLVLGREPRMQTACPICRKQ
jgi:hypothetical protein